jgi:hypothetical protein
MEYISLIWSDIPELVIPIMISVIETYHRVCNKSNTTGVTYGTRTAYMFSGFRVARSLVFCVMFCRSGITSSGISDQMRDIYSICRCYWNVATYKWKVHNGKIDIISFVVKLDLNRPSLSISRCRSRLETDLSVSVVSFISEGTCKMR